MFEWFKNSLHTRDVIDLILLHGIMWNYMLVKSQVAQNLVGQTEYNEIVWMSLGCNILDVALLKQILLYLRRDIMPILNTHSDSISFLY